MSVGLIKIVVNQGTNGHKKKKKKNVTENISFCHTIILNILVYPFKDNRYHLFKYSYRNNSQECLFILKFV